MASTQAPDAGSADLIIASSTDTPLDAVRSQKQPPPESRESIWLRRLAILSFWIVVVFFGLPIWLKTTAVYRAELPLQEMTNWAEGKVRNASLSSSSLLTSRRYASQSSPCALRWKLPYRPPMPRISYA
jgi:hypothetical protein